MTLTDRELDLLNKLLPKYKAYKKPTQQQQLLVALGEKPNKDDDDIKKLQLILSAEKKAIELYEKEKAVKDLLQAEKALERKKFENGTYELGGLFRALLKENNPAFVQAFKTAIQNGKIRKTYKDNTPLFADYANLLTTPQNNAQLTQNAPATNIPPTAQNAPQSQNKPQWKAIKNPAIMRGFF